MTYGSWDKKWVPAASCSPAMLDWIYLLPFQHWMSLLKQQSREAAKLTLGVKAWIKWIATEICSCHQTPQQHEAGGKWETASLLFLSLQSCEKNMLGEAREGWKGWEQKGQESLGDGKGVKVDICVLQFVRAEYKFTEFLEVNVKTGRRLLLALTQNTAVLGIVLHRGKLVSGAGSNVLPHCPNSTAGLAQVEEATDSRDAALAVGVDIILHI